MPCPHRFIKEIFAISGRRGVGLFFELSYKVGTTIKSGSFANLTDGHVGIMK